MMKEYDVVFYVRSEFRVRVTAENVEDAREFGRRAFEEKDFSPLVHVDGFCDRVVDKDSGAVYFDQGGLYCED